MLYSPSVATKRHRQKNQTREVGKLSNQQGKVAEPAKRCRSNADDQANP